MKALVLKTLFVVSVVTVAAMAWAKTSAVEPCGANDTEWTGTLCNPTEPALAGLNQNPANTQGGTGGVVCRECEIAKQQNQVALLASTNPTPRSAIPPKDPKRPDGRR